MEIFTAIVEQDLKTNLYVGFIPGLRTVYPSTNILVRSQGKTLDELRDNLMEVLEVILKEWDSSFKIEFQEKQVGIEYLRKLHTKQLIKLKNQSYGSFLRCGYVFYENIPLISQEELKLVLSERLHVPNGGETKRIRKAAASYKTRFFQSTK